MVVVQQLRKENSAMLANPAASGEIPAETAQLAKKVFRKGNRYLTLRDELGPIFSASDFAGLYAVRGAPGIHPVQLALVTLVQYIEDLSDRDAAEAVRSRIDLKYLLGLPLADEGFDYSVLNEFRQRLLSGVAEGLLLDKLLAACVAQGWLKAGGSQRTDSTHVLAAVRSLSRYELVGETLRSALNSLAVVAPAWVQQQAPPDWYGRYRQRVEEYRLPKGQTQRAHWVLQVGQDGQQLLQWLDAPQTPPVLGSLPAVQTLRTVWSQHYELVGETLRLRQAGELPSAAALVQSPYDPEARYSEKRSLTWQGYKVHYTESCDADRPHLITQVTTDPAPQPDCNATGRIQADLAAKQLLPAQQVLDGGYTDADHYVESQTQHQVDLVGPTTPDVSWQAKAANGFDHTHFTIDWDKQQATCPGGKTSHAWLPDPKPAANPTILIRFHQPDCLACPLRTACTRSRTGPRSLRIRPQPQYAALQTARQRQQTPEFQQRYQQRAGIEGTLSQAVRRSGLRHSRFIGLAKTHLQHLATAAAINLLRLVDFLLGVDPSCSRSSPFASLAPT
jgi:transposase